MAERITNITGTALVGYPIVAEDTNIPTYNWKQAQTFVVSDGSWDNIYIKLWLDRQYNMGGVPDPGNLVLELREDSPTGDVLDTVTIDRTSVPLDEGWFTFTFDAATELASGNTYCVVLSCAAGIIDGFDSDYIDWDYFNGGSSYGSGSRFYKRDDIGWTEVATKDAKMEVWGEAALTPPTKATNPTPTDTADTITLDQDTITWEDGGGATSYDVYYGEDAGSLALVSEGQADLSFTISGIDSGSPFDYTISRAWRIDSINADGTTTGDVWTFTTITFNAPPAGIRGYDTSVGGDEGGFAGGAIGDKQLHVKTRLVAFANNKVWYEDT